MFLNILQYSNNISYQIWFSINCMICYIKQTIHFELLGNSNYWTSLFVTTERMVNLKVTALKVLKYTWAMVLKILRYLFITFDSKYLSVKISGPTKFEMEPKNINIKLKCFSQFCGVNKYRLEWMTVVVANMIQVSIFNVLTNHKLDYVTFLSTKEKT